MMGLDSTLSLGHEMDNVTITEDQQQRARRYVAGEAHDAEDARRLLDMLGLLP
jgi:hypothetical protein